MNIDECFLLGYIRRTHGARGALVCRIDADSPERYDNISELFIATEGGLWHYRVTSANVLPGGDAIISLEGVDDVDAARALVGKSAYLPLSMLPPLEGNNFYFHEVIGFRLTDSVSGRSGIITDTVEAPGQTLFRVDMDGEDRLIPMVREWVVQVDRSRNSVEMKLPEGMLEL